MLPKRMHCVILYLEYNMAARKFFSRKDTFQKCEISHFSKSQENENHETEERRLTTPIYPTHPQAS